MKRIIVKDIFDAIAKLEKYIGELELGYKILLIQDGTLEYALSVINGKRIRFNVIKQMEYDDYIERYAILKGNYVIYARSIIYKDALPSAIIDEIRERRLGIGRILRKHKIETFRNILEVGYDEMIYRVYEIIYNNNVAFKIREDIIKKY